MEDFVNVLRSTTTQYRKGERVTETERNGVKVVDVYAMPHVDEAPKHLKMFDMVFLWVGVDLEKAEENREHVLEELRNYPDPERLAGGPSYIEVGAQVGSQDAALCFFALGAALELFEVITPMTMGIEGDEAVELAQGGLVMITGWKEG